MYRKRVHRNIIDSALEYNNKPMFVDKDCQANTMYGLDEEHLKFYALQDWSWMEDDKGSVLSKVSGEDAYEAVMYGYVELGTSARNAHFKIEDISEAGA